MEEIEFSRWLSNAGKTFCPISPLQKHTVTQSYKFVIYVGRRMYVLLQKHYEVQIANLYYRFATYGYQKIKFEIRYRLTPCKVFELLFLLLRHVGMYCTRQLWVYQNAMIIFFCIAVLRRLWLLPICHLKCLFIITILALVHFLRHVSLNCLDKDPLQSMLIALVP